jgi:hypothetical protein
VASVVSRCLLGYMCSLALTLMVFAQNPGKPWQEWSKKDVEKILTDSPWSRTKVETDVSEMFYQPTANARNAPNAPARIESGATNQEINIKYQVRFFSARPIRQALARAFALRQKLDEQTREALNNFAELKSENSIIVTVTWEATDQRFGNKVMQAFNSAITSTLKNKSYLERKDGQRLFLEEYVTPGKDGFGARFIFPKTVDGKPFIDENNGTVRFFAEYAEGMKINATFKTSEMIYKGQLEY